MIAFRSGYGWNRKTRRIRDKRAAHSSLNSNLRPAISWLVEVIIENASLLQFND